MRLPRLKAVERSNYRKHKSQGEEIAEGQEGGKESGGHKLSGVVGNKSRAPADASWEIRPLPLQMELTATTNVAAVALL